MKVTYTADDGTEFDSADECLAYEGCSSELYEKWHERMTQDFELLELWQFLIRVQIREIEFDELADFWAYRRRFVEVAKTFMDAEPTLKHLIYGD